MKKKNMFKNFLVIIVSYLLILFLMTVLLKIPSDYIFCGIELPVMFGVGNIDFIRLFEWLWIYAPFWFTVAYYIDWFIRSQGIVLIRYGNYRKWYTSLMKDILFFQCIYILILNMTYTISGASGVFLPVVLISVHAYFILIVLLTLRVFSGSPVLSMFCVLLFEIFSFVLGDELGVSAIFIPTSWGMYFRCSVYDTYMTFPISKIIFTQLAISFLLIIITYNFIRTKKVGVDRYV